MTTPGEFSVTQFFSDDTCEIVLTNVDAGEALTRAGQLSRSVGGQIGTTKRIILTDAGDFTVFEWLFGKGVVFPPQPESEGAR